MPESSIEQPDLPARPLSGTERVLLQGEVQKAIETAHEQGATIAAIVKIIAETMRDMIHSESRSKKGLPPLTPDSTSFHAGNDMLKPIDATLRSAHAAGLPFTHIGDAMRPVLEKIAGRSTNLAAIEHIPYVTDPFAGRGAGGW